MLEFKKKILKLNYAIILNGKLLLKLDNVFLASKVKDRCFCLENAKVKPLSWNTRFKIVIDAIGDMCINYGYLESVSQKSGFT